MTIYKNKYANFVSCADKDNICQMTWRIIFEYLKLVDPHNCNSYVESCWSFEGVFTKGCVQKLDFVLL